MNNVRAHLLEHVGAGDFGRTIRSDYGDRRSQYDGKSSRLIPPLLAASIRFPICGPGYGQNEVNDAEAIWTKKLLAKISSEMTMLLIGIFLCGVMVLYIVASVVEVHQRSA